MINNCNELSVFHSATSEWSRCTPFLDACNFVFIHRTIYCARWYAAFAEVQRLLYCKIWWGWKKVVSNYLQSTSKDPAKIKMPASCPFRYMKLNKNVCSLSLFMLQLGFLIRGGKEHKCPLFVSKVCFSSFSLSYFWCFGFTKTLDCGHGNGSCVSLKKELIQKPHGFLSHEDSLQVCLVKVWGKQNHHLPFFCFRTSWKLNTVTHFSAMICVCHEMFDMFDESCITNLTMDSHVL